MPRATPIHDKSQVPAEAQHVAEDVIGVFGRIRGPFSVFLNSPKLADKMLALVKFNRNDCIVEPRLLSHAILAAVRERESDYPVFNRLLTKHDAQWMTELITIAHNFTVLCGVTNAFEVAVPPDGDQLPS